MYLPLIPIRSRRLLEIGCGVGRLVRHLAADCGEIHGVDISREMIARARERQASPLHAHFTHSVNGDLAAFADSSFDLVYSFAVFQHIPAASLVYRYLQEAHRVLKPGGLLTAQFNGIPRLEEAHDTWTGVGIAEEEELLRYAQANHWAALSSEGADSQYMWLTWRKSDGQAMPDPRSLSVTIRGVAHPDGGSGLVAGGPRGYAELHVRGLPDQFMDLTTLTATMQGLRIPINYIGPLQEGDFRQINVRIPETIPVDEHGLALQWNGLPISNQFKVAVRRRHQFDPQIVRITDEQEGALHAVVRSTGMKIHLSGCQDVHSVNVTVGGISVDGLRSVCVDRVSRYFLLSVPVPMGVAGRQPVLVSVDKRQLDPVEVEIIRQLG